MRLIFLIRTEDQRREIGDYVATLLENVGFIVDRQYKTAAESSPIWIGGNPADGRWHIYTGGWVSLAIDRDQADMFNGYYTPRGRPDPLWQAYKPSPRLDKVAEILDRRDYSTLGRTRRADDRGAEACDGRLGSRLAGGRGVYMAAPKGSGFGGRSCRRHLRLDSLALHDPICGGTRRRVNFANPEHADGTLESGGGK